MWRPGPGSCSQAESRWGTPLPRVRRLVVSGCSPRGLRSLAAENEDEQGHECEVDEEHRLDQTHGQEEDGLQAALGLRLTSNALDVGRASKAVTDTGTDGATTEGETATDESTGERDGLVDVRDCHCFSYG